MGLTVPVLRLIARVHKARPIAGPILTLGRQAIYATFEEVCAAWRAEGVMPLALPDGYPTLTNIPTFMGGPTANFTNDGAVFLSLAGIEPMALDESPYEGADLIADLNQPVPNDLENRFDLILDAGTTEHVFDVKQSFQNIARMLRVGGRVIHYSPANNWLQHGFYQFSPTLLYDFYGVNGFDNIECFLLETTRKSRARNYSGGSRHWEWDPKRPYGSLTSKYALSLIFVAEKMTETRYDAIPQQGQFLGIGMGGRMGESSNCATPSSATPPSIPGWRLFLKHLLPEVVKRPIREGEQVVRRRLQPDLTVEPWGLRYLGKI